MQEKTVSNNESKFVMKMNQRVNVVAVDKRSYPRTTQSL